MIFVSVYECDVYMLILWYINNFWVIQYRSNFVLQAII